MPLGGYRGAGRTGRLII